MALPTDMADSLRRNRQSLGKRRGAESVDDGLGVSGRVGHARDYNASVVKHNPFDVVTQEVVGAGNRCDLTTMSEAHPYADIGQRLRWHREQIAQMNQRDYAAAIDVKRATYTCWETGTQRLSLNGALALRSRYGLPLDWLFLGIDDALPMTLRNAWLSKPTVRS